MLTPYDWQQGISHRSEFIEGRLAQGAPILALSVEEGIVIFTYRRNSRKIFEIYDQLAFSAIGQQSDIEALRVSSIDFAHQEGFQRSEKDVTLRRVVTAMSTPIKRAFADFSSSPFVVRSLFCEVGKSVGDDAYALLDYEGDFRMIREFAYVAGTDKFADEIKEKLQKLFDKKLSANDAYTALKSVWDETYGKNDLPSDAFDECVLLDRSIAREVRFRFLSEDQYW